MQVVAFTPKVQRAKWWKTLSNASTWWRHQIETFSALLVLYAGISPATGEFPPQRPVKQSFDVFFDRRCNKRLRKQSWGWWLERPSRSFWCHCTEYRFTFALYLCTMWELVVHIYIGHIKHDTLWQILYKLFYTECSLPRFIWYNWGIVWKDISIHPVNWSNNYTCSIRFLLKYTLNVSLVPKHMDLVFISLTLLLLLELNFSRPYICFWRPAGLSENGMRSPAHKMTRDDFGGYYNVNVLGLCQYF